MLMPGSWGIEGYGSSAITTNRGQKRTRQLSPERQEPHKRTKLNLLRRPPAHRRRVKFASQSPSSPFAFSLLENSSQVVVSAPHGKSSTASLDKPHLRSNNDSDEEGVDEEDEIFTEGNFWGDDSKRDKPFTFFSVLMDQWLYVEACFHAVLLLTIFALALAILALIRTALALFLVLTIILTLALLTLLASAFVEISISIGMRFKYFQFF
jgi:hypothetical protein